MMLCRQGVFSRSGGVWSVWFIWLVWFLWFVWSRSKDKQDKLAHQINSVVVIFTPPRFIQQSNDDLHACLKSGREENPQPQRIDSDWHLRGMSSRRNRLTKYAVFALSILVDNFLLTARKKTRIRRGKKIVSRDRLTSLLTEEVTK